MHGAIDSQVYIVLSSPFHGNGWCDCDQQKEGDTIITPALFVTCTTRPRANSHLSLSHEPIFCPIRIGIFFILPCIENYAKVDLRTLTFDVPPQEILTKDSVTVSVDAVVYYRVSNATVSIANVENAHHSTRLLAQTTLRNMLGTHNLHEILSDRETISSSMQTVLDEATEHWGIKVERTEM